MKKFFLRNKKNLFKNSLKSRFYSQISFDLNDQQKELKDLASKFTKQYIIPNVIAFIYFIILLNKNKKGC